MAMTGTSSELRITLLSLVPRGLLRKVLIRGPMMKKQQIIRLRRRKTFSTVRPFMKVLRKRFKIVKVIKAFETEPNRPRNST